ncbi:hypothetical protein M409DRAFT_15910 [Zasmidium cellare ATCC 36951]|uniref:Cytochrome P450 n=1 Tax=Zasmidium cellare ATCC 36951 TaxID=1080233 RepID=A0A6A6D5Z0_ZASCE|nr:uncharacterized protein M409DRAFT_15910 [Zasmidium cellare ATCC 36951]KAF2173632.1 hypothetical protein M409DRAFT_15910 [Zasmidium cellare ATCC 36951]
MFSVWILCVGLALTLVSNLIYDIWFHPLREYPGPRYAAASRIWYSLHVFRGHHKNAIKRLHDEFGLVVRIAPNELSYIDPRAWEDIYGRSAHENRTAALEKELDFFETAFNNSDSLVDANSRDFKSQKNNATRAFSNGSLLRRSPTMATYIDRSIELLRTYLSDKQVSTIDIDPWIGNIVLDTHAKLTISQDFGAVELGPIPHTLVTNMHRAVTTIQYCTQLQYLPHALKFLTKLMPSRDIFTVLGKIPPLGTAIAKRIAKEHDESVSQDFVSHMIQDSEADVRNIATVRSNATVFVLSAVETLPGFICSILYYLLETPEYYKAASNELRSRFGSSAEITLQSTQQLEYLGACMREGLRASPPAVGTLTRRIPPQGAEVCGRFVPGGVTVGIHNWSVTHSERFWTHPERFRPERWTGDGDYADDLRSVFNPFGVGPRTCVARHLVLLEATLIVAKLLFAFDMTLDPKNCGDWPVHKGHFVPTRGSLFIGLKPHLSEKSASTPA